MTTSTMRSSLRLRLGAKLGLAFTGVLAVMLASLAVVLLKSAEASHAYERAIAWKVGRRGRCRPGRGHAPAAGRPGAVRRDRRGALQARVAGGRRRRREGRRRRRGLNDPVVGKLAAGATEADRKHDAAVTTKLFPAMERGDMVAAGAALALADKYVRIPLQAQEKIGAHVRERQTAGHRRRQVRRGRRAHRRASSPACCASLLAAAIVFLVIARHPPLGRAGAGPPERPRAQRRHRSAGGAGRGRRTATSRVRSRPTRRRSRPPAPTRSATSPAPPTTSAPACTRPSTPTTACATAWPG